MYLITNRHIYADKKGTDIFGSTPNNNGAQEITFVKAERKGKSWKTEIVTDELDKEVAKNLKKKHKIDIDLKEQWYGSLKVACEIYESAMESNKSILFFVHGYNNDVDDVLEAADAIEKLYNVIVVPFTWPANGGNFITGTAAYLSDKADARQSTHALNRIVGKLGFYHSLLTEGSLKKLRKKATDAHPDNQIAAREYFTKLQGKVCKTKISLLCHSMGNYLLKHTLMTGDSQTKNLVFDNICLISADANNKNHKVWVERLDVRNRCYIVINESDSALLASRIKPGEEQFARLGHYTKKLDSTNAYYIDVTDAEGIGSDHTYFKGDSVSDNAELNAIFRGMFKGLSIEKNLLYQADNNSYVLNSRISIDEIFDEELE